MKKRNRLLAILLTAIMTISMLPSAAFATEAVDTGETAESAVVEVSSIGEEQDAEAAVEEVSAVEEAVEETVEAAVEDEEAEAEETVAEEAEAEEAAEPTADQEEAAAEETAAPAEEETAAPAEEEETAAPAEEETAEPAIEAEEVTMPEEAAVTVEWPVTLESMGDDYVVTASFDETAGFPADVKMNVSEIKKSSDAYQDYYDQALEAVQNETDKDVELTYARFFDITFYTEEGEVEPTGPVNVSIKYRKAIEVESKDDVHVLHFDDNEKAAPEIMDIETSGREDKVNEVSFEADSFSIYAVVGTADAVEDESRMTLNFYNGSNLIATVYVKNNDTEDEIDSIIYDPGAGTVGSGQLFKGWIEKENYSTEDLANKQTIADIRTWAKGKVNKKAEDGTIIKGTIAEGETHNFYAMIFNTFSVSYKDEDDVTMHSIALITAGGSVDYTIDQSYTPKDQDEVFLGWYADPETSVTPKDSNAEYPYKYNTDVTISGNVVFKVYAPKGHWLNFEGNGTGADYTPPQFLKEEDPTVEPAEPKRKGYVFDGWYTEEPAEEGADPGGVEFTFGSVITDNTTLYAKWKTAPSANYSVIIWKQRSTDAKDAADSAKTYDVAEVISLSGTPGASASSVVTRPNNNTNVNTGRGSNVRNYSVNGQQKGWTGFHAARYNENVTIAADGTTVLNVYYDRNLITITFNAGNRYIHNDDTGAYQNTVTYTGLFDSELTFDWPTQYWTNSSGTGSASNTLWSYSSGWSTTTLSFLGAFKLPTPANVTLSLSRADAGSNPRRFIRQKEDGSWPDEDETEYILTINMSGNSFEVTEKYAGFSLQDWRSGEYTTSETGWTSVSADTTITGSQLNIRYKRDEYNIEYLDGTYFDGNGAIIHDATASPLKEVKGIYYGAKVESYNKGGADYYEPDASNQYVFAGWYVDPTCNSPYTFTTMPANNIAVYAKWVEKQYRVFLHPNVPSDDASFSMGNQSTCFRGDYNEKIAGGNPIKTQRDGYDLIGWYMDEACTVPFNFAAYVLNDTNVSTPYDTTDDGKYNPTANTELDKYGNVDPEQVGVNKDAQNQRIWILSRLDLYAKWRSTIDGAKGIELKYDAGDGDNAPTDEYLYLDNAEATAGAASTPKDQTKQFLYWNVQKYNYNTGKYEKTDVNVYPGDVFTVLKSDSLALVTEWFDPEYVPDPDDPEAPKEDIYTVEDPTPGTTPPEGMPSRYSKIKTASYTVHLIAVYGDADVPTPTHITWYANNGTDYRVTNSNLQVNEAVDILVPDENITYTNYDFIGWARCEEKTEGTVTTINGQNVDTLNLNLGEGDLFLKWENGKFFATETTGSGYAEGDEVKQIAADEKSPYHGMVAVWKRANFHLYHSSTGETEDLPVPEESMDLTKKVADGCLYGGYYHYDKVSEDSEDRARGEVYTDSGLQFMPTADAYYYLKEVDAKHVIPKAYLVKNTNHNNLIQGLYAIMDIDEIEYTYEKDGEEIDEDMYEVIGMEVNGVTDSYEIDTMATEGVTFNGKHGGTITSTNLSGISNAFVGLNDLTDLVLGNAEITIKGYFITRDGVKVYGAKERWINFPEGDKRYGGMPLFKGWGDVSEGYTSSGTRSFTSEPTSVSASNGRRLTVVRTLTVAAPSDDIGYKITKIYDSSTEEQKVEGGNNTGKIDYTPKSGYMFAGWYQDAAYTIPADFSNVSGDMTVYAKFTSNKDVKLAFKRKGGTHNGINTFNVTVTVNNQDQLENVSVNIVDGNTAVLPDKTVKTSGTGKKVKYTTEYKGIVDVVGLSLVDTFTSFVSWTTPDGTTVEGANKKCTYQLGNVTVR